MAELPPSWRDHEDRATDRPAPPGPGASPFYEPIGDFQGERYRRNAFAAGTTAEVDALVRRLRLRPGMCVLDVGCGDGRHLRGFAARGIGGVGVDISEGLLDAARHAATAAGLSGTRFVRGDARDLLAVEGIEPGRFDAAMAVCQGGLGTSPATDPQVLAGLAAAVRPGGLVAFTAFHALFAARHLAPGDAYDVVHGVHHQLSEVRGADDERRAYHLWTACYTVGEAARLARDVGLQVLELTGAEPGEYGRTDGPALDDPELLVVARRPTAG